MSLQEAHHLDDYRIRIIAERLIAEEMRALKVELQMLRADLARSSAVQRHELQAFYSDAMSILRGEQ
jgi:hypothetical protein